MINVLVPTDFSNNAWNAICYGINFFREEPVNFYILHVDIFESPHYDTVSNGVVFSASGEKTISDRLQETLDRIHETFPSLKHRFYKIQEQSLFIDGIKKSVKKYEINFILMGTKGASGLKEVTIGSRTGEVITKVKCPILVIPEKAEYKVPQKIVFPTDFNSTYKNKILLTLSEVMSMHEPSIEVLHISKARTQLSDFQNQNKSYLDDFLDFKSHKFHFLEDTNLETGLSQFIESEEIDMIAMVAKNVNFFQRLLFKPSVERISYHTRIPFLVLHD